MTYEKLDRRVFLLLDDSIEEITYKDYLREYWADETTTPRGVAPRLFVAEPVDSGLPFELRTWGSGGSGPARLVHNYDTKIEAELALYGSWEYDYHNSSSDAPRIFDSRQEAFEDIASGVGRSYEVIERWFAMTAAKKERQALTHQKSEERRQKEKIKEDAAIAAEAACIEPDAQLFAELHQAGLLKGEAKAKALQQAQIAFLGRIGYGRIRTDFWKVFKIVNKKSLPNSNRIV